MHQRHVKRKLSDLPVIRQDVGSIPSEQTTRTSKAVHFFTRRRIRQRDTDREKRKKKRLKQQRTCCNICINMIFYTICIIGIYFYFMFGALVPVNKKDPHPPPRPIPFPLDNETVSVVIMNYARPRMLHETSMISTFLQHPAINEILLCHANKKTTFHLNHPKVKNIDAVAKNEELGMALRFYYCTEAINEWIIQIDDDMELDYSAINELIYYMKQDPHRIVGHYARQYNFWKVPHRHGYDFATTLSGPVEVILTKILIMEKQICREFLKYANIMDDMVLDSKPLWNGEDIFVNLVANHYYGVPLNGPYRNYAIADLNIWEANDTLKDDDSGINDVSGNMDRHMPWSAGIKDYNEFWWRSLGHYAYRGRLWATAKARLAQLDNIIKDEM